MTSCASSRVVSSFRRRRRQHFDSKGRRHRRLGGLDPGPLGGHCFTRSSFRGGAHTPIFHPGRRRSPPRRCRPAAPQQSPPRRPRPAAPQRSPLGGIVLHVGEDPPRGAFDLVGILILLGALVVLLLGAADPLLIRRVIITRELSVGHMPMPSLVLALDSLFYGVLLRHGSGQCVARSLGNEETRPSLLHLLDDLCVVFTLFRLLLFRDGIELVQR